jgi:hypothetical protein
MTSDKLKYRQQMLSMVEDWKRSGQNQRAYCQAHSISYHQFHYWYKRYKMGQVPGNDSGSSFIEVQLPAPQSHDYAEVIYPDGKRVLFHQAVDVSFLKALIK